VNQILDEIDAKDKPTIMVFNKIDAYQPEPLDDDSEDEPTKANYSIEDWKRTWMSKLGDKALFISALNKENLEDFRKRVYKEVRKIHITRFPYNNFLYPDVEDIT
jgi:GTP-binding protein HflX